MTTIRAVTADELWDMPSNGIRRELVRGELRTMSPAGFEHGTIVANLTTLLTLHVKANGLGAVAGAETGFVLGDDPATVRAPDVGFVRLERLKLISAGGRPQKFWRGAPDLAVEVLSPSDTVFELDEKVNDWLEAGTRMVWVVHPRHKTLTVHRLGGATQVLAATERLEGEGVIPGFHCQVHEVFE